MLNRAKSPKANWLKYPVFCLSTLIVAAFADPHPIHAVSRYVPQPIAETIIAVTKLAEQPTEITANDIPGIADKYIVNETINTASAAKSSNQKLELSDSLVQPLIDKDSVRSSPSRYIVYEDNRMWWIITPKATLDDFITIKKELAKYGAILQLMTIKFDPLYTFIEHLDYKLVNTSSGGSTGQEGNESIGQPIRTTGGYLEWKNQSDPQKFSTSSYVEIHPSAKILPEAIRKVIIDDETSVAKSIDDRKMEELVQVGIHKYGHLGIGPRRFSPEEIVKQSGGNSYLTVHPDSSLSLDETVDYARVYINNKPVEPQAIRLWKINQLYTLAVVYKQGSGDGKQPGTRYILFYFNENKKP